MIVMKVKILHDLSLRHSVLVIETAALRLLAVLLSTNSTYSLHFNSYLIDPVTFPACNFHPGRPARPAASRRKGQREGQGTSRGGKEEAKGHRRRRNTDRWRHCLPHPINFRAKVARKRRRRCGRSRDGARAVTRPHDRLVQHVGVRGVGVAGARGRHFRYASGLRNRQKARRTRVSHGDQL